MPSAGAVCPPVIGLLRDQETGLSGNHIDTLTSISLTTETPSCKIYFTTDGIKPSPFQRKVAGRELTFKYFAPFTLKQGKRTLKAIAVSRDGLHESAVVTKTFSVDDVGNHAMPKLLGTSLGDGLNDTRLSDTKKRKPWFPTFTKSCNLTPKHAWIESEDIGDNQLQDSPFNPTNYSGTQINVWKAAGIPYLPQTSLGTPSYTTQYGFLTEQMIQGLNSSSQNLTVSDLRKVLEESKNHSESKPPLEAAPFQPAIEYKFDDISPENISPGNGNYKEQISHVYAHMLEYAKLSNDFQLKIAQPKIGKMLSGEFEDEGDGYKITLVMAKPGIPRGALRKPSQERKEKTKPKQRKTELIEKPKPKPKKADPYYSMETEELQHEGTIKPYAYFSAEQDCQVLRQAMKGLGTDEDAIINTLVYRSSVQRQETISLFKTMFGKDLISELKSELSGNFLDAVVGLCMAPAEFDARMLRRSMKGLGTDEDVLIEILCTRSNAQIKQIISKYKEIFNHSLENDIISDTSGHFKRILVALVNANRSSSKQIDRNKAHQDARTLYEAGENKWGTDESCFNTVLASRSYPQLRATFQEYAKISKKDIVETLKSELSGDLLRSMLAIVRCVKNKPNYFARQLQKAMKGIGTDDKTLVRIMISRCEVDMVQIKEEFQKVTGQPLEQYICDDISGDYQKIILSLASGGIPPESAVKTGKAFVEATKSKTVEQLDEEVKLETESIKEDPTVVPSDNFNAEEDAKVLRKAMKGLGTDEKAIINIVACRSLDQRQKVAKTYKTMYGKDLVDDLKGELSGHLKDAVVGLFMKSSEFDAHQLRKAVKGLGTDEKVLIEIICSRTNQQLRMIREAYKNLFNKELEADICSDTSGHFKRLLVSLVQANRPDGPTFNRNKARQDANVLHEAGEKKWGTDESQFNVILASRSYAQLRATFQEYARLTNRDIESTIKSEMTGDIRNGMLTIVQNIQNKAAYFSAQLYKAMHGLGTDDNTLVRILVSRCEVDMVQIKEEFHRNYKQTLGMFIKDDTSGDYRNLLLALIKEE